MERRSDNLEGAGGAIPLASREALASLAHGVCIELGVAAGDFTLSLLTLGNPDVLWGVDKWNDHHDAAEMAKAIARVDATGKGGIWHPLHCTFAAAAPMFPVDHFDLIYIDGYAHTGQEGGKTLADWWPKLKRGGIFAGHDYCPRFPLTVKAVDDFAAAHNLTINVTNDPPYPSWWTRKP